MEGKKPGYDHASIEKKWQEKWQKDGIYTVEDKVEGKENHYTLVEFTYPSGNLHVGHWYAFSVPDIYARFKRMQGYNVLYPMGFDAFGLPAENAAIKLGADPKKWTFEQMDKMRIQLRSMGAMFDWDREVVSCDPSYYKWTQWMFNQFLKHDLVYRDVTKVNWCPKDQTILANEQVVDGRCDRCGSEVIQRDQEQWMLRITKYADQLIDDLDSLDWPEEIKAAQRNWIGRSEGSEIEFQIKDRGEKIKVFTTRADTLFGVTYVVLAPEYPLISELLEAVENKGEAQSYINETRKKLELERQQSKEKTGVELKGIKAINPANGEEVPVWIADYVLVGYGTGAVMAVPAHDERDFAFAKKYNLPIKTVIVKELENIKRVTALLITKEKKLILQSWNLENGKKLLGRFGGHSEKGENIFETLERELIEELELDVKNHTHFFFDDLGNNKEAGVVFVVEGVDRTKLVQHEGDEIVEISDGDSLEFLSENTKKVWEKYLAGVFDSNIEPGLLVNSAQFDGLSSEEAKKKITDEVGGKLVKTYRLRDWGISRQRYWGCPIPIVYDPDGKAHPVPDEYLPWLLPTDVDHTPSGVAPLAKSKELFERTEKLFGKGWTPEVETMDTFVDSSWYFYRYLDNKNDGAFADTKRLDEWMPIDLYMGGAEHTTMHVLYSRFWVKAMRDVGLVQESEPYTVRRNRGLILGPDGQKMSKSKGNVINPDEIVERLGADTVRMYLAFMGPYGVTTNYPWDPNGVVGVRRFLERVWKLKEKVGEGSDTATLHKTIKKLSSDIPEHKYNTAIAQMMILVNEWEKTDAISEAEYKTLLKLLAPFAPHMTEELWAAAGEKESIHLSSWPTYDEGKAKDQSVTLGVQVNGKLRAELEVAAGAAEGDIEAMALALPKIQGLLEGKAPKKVIVVPGRIVNIVV